MPLDGCEAYESLNKMASMRKLLLMRHAKSSWDEPALRDHDRPLNKRGNRDAPKIGEMMQQAGVLPDLILSSTATRTRETVEHLVHGLGSAVETRFVSELYHAAPSDLLEALSHASDESTTVLLVAHNPGIEELVSALCGHHERCPTATLAHFELALTSWADLDSTTTGQLVALWRPREVF